MRAIFFDIGGVLALTPPTGWHDRWEAELGLAPDELGARLDGVWRDGTVGRITEQQAEAEARRLLGLDEAQLQRLLADQWEEYLGSANHELIAYFASLRPRYRTGIISNSFVGAREREQQRYAFGDLCDLIVYSHEVGVSKPERKIYDLACEGLQVSPKESVFLDDVHANVRAAQDLGMHAILFEGTAQAIRDIEAALS